MTFTIFTGFFVMSLIFNNLLALFQHYKPIKFVENSTGEGTEGKQDDEESGVTPSTSTTTPDKVVMEEEGVAMKGGNDSPKGIDIKTAIAIPLFWSIPLAALGWGVYACFLKILKLH